jgi:glutamate/tyrosine decarboxylase-like PLP-dependent enzyme
MAEPREASLDPDDWTQARALGRTMLDDMFTFLESVRERPVWRSPDAAAREVYERPLSQEGRALEAIYQDFKDHILPFGFGHTHPRFWGWVNGTGTVTGMLADLLASGMNGHVSFGDHAEIYVEQQVVRWLISLLGLPPASTGLLVSSGSAANLTGMAVARDEICQGARQKGVRVSGGSPMVYASDQVHNSVDKMVGLLGIGRENLRRVPSRADFTCDVDALAAAIARDRAAGLTPVCIVGTAGTVSTGAIDDLNALANLAARENVWLHVDAAFAAALSLSPVLRSKLSGIERADSVAFDLHKWFYLPYDVGCAIVCRPGAQRRSFSPPAAYLGEMERGIAAPGYPFGELGVDLSRGFRALKVWMTLQEYGTAKYAAQIEQNVAQAAYIADRVNGTEDLELLAPVPLNVVCFRHHPAELTETHALDRHNENILMTLHERGIAAPSFTRIRGVFAIRTAITNHRSRRADFDVLLDAVTAIGREQLQTISEREHRQGESNV